MQMWNNYFSNYVEARISWNGNSFMIIFQFPFEFVFVWNKVKLALFWTESMWPWPKKARDTDIKQTWMFNHHGRRNNNNNSSAKATNDTCQIPIPDEPAAHRYHSIRLVRSLSFFAASSYISTAFSSPLHFLHTRHETWEVQEANFMNLDLVFWPQKNTKEWAQSQKKKKKKKRSGHERRSKIV